MPKGVNKNHRAEWPGGNGGSDAVQLGFLALDADAAAFFAVFPGEVFVVGLQEQLPFFCVFLQ